MRGKYSEEFKAEAVALALSSDEPYSIIARDLGVKYNTFTNWIYAHMNDPKPKSKKIRH